MNFRHVLHLIVIMPIVVYVANSDSTSVWSGDLLFSDIEFSSSTEALAIKQSDFFLNAPSTSSDVLDSLSEETNDGILFSSDNVGLEATNDSGLFLINNVDLDDKVDSDHFSIHIAGLDDGSVEADASSLEASPVISKSRIRRQHASDVCNDPGIGHFRSQGLPSDAAGGQSHGDNLGIFQKNLGISSLASVLSAKEAKNRHNAVCEAVTMGALPWGVCYQPIGEPLEPIGTSVVPPDSGGTLFASYIVDPSTVGKSKSESGAKPYSIC